jgi:hypothetical protein
MPSRVRPRSTRRSHWVAFSQRGASHATCSDTGRLETANGLQGGRLADGLREFRCGLRPLHPECECCERRSGCGSGSCSLCFGLAVNPLSDVMMVASIRFTDLVKSRHAGSAAMPCGDHDALRQSVPAGRRMLNGFGRVRKSRLDFYLSLAR